MWRANRPFMSLMVAAALTCVMCRPAAAAAPPADPPRGDAVIGAWQHHKVSFDYVGFTTLYTCDGLEDHVRQILRHLGARKDARVTASGCPGPSSTPSRDARVDVDFYTLAPAADPSAPDAVAARWTSLHVTPQRPYFVGAGDCELIQGMKDFITRNFSLRDLAYRTACFPHDVALDSFEIEGRVLMAVPLAQKAAQESD